jgi:hypothetical protein
MKFLLSDWSLFPNVREEVFLGVTEAIDKRQIELIVGFEALLFINSNNIRLSSSEIISIIKNVAYTSYNFGLNSIGEELLASDRLKYN